MERIPEDARVSQCVPLVILISEGFAIRTLTHFLAPSCRLDLHVGSPSKRACQIVDQPAPRRRSCLYLTTLSFESILISYLKSIANLSDFFIAVMRGVSVAMGLLGTLVMPVLEQKLGITRAGAWSIW